MSLDSSPNATSPEARPWLTMLVRVAIALCAGLLIMVAIGHLAWSKGAYSDQEIKSAETSDDAKIRDLRGQEITQLRITLGRRLPLNRQADLYFRLAEIYLEAYQQEFILEGRVHEKRLEKGITDRYIDRAHSMPYLAQGVKACQEILKFNIAYHRLDQVYYFLGFNYRELGNKSQSLRYFEELSRKFPGSPFAAEALREMGDAAFDAHQYPRAQAYYERALKNAEPHTVPRIYHKLAWSYYRLRQHDQAVEMMKQAISTASKSGEKYLSLKEEALRDMAIFMTEIGRVEDAIGYFQSVAGDKAYFPKALEKLGKQYERNVETGKAIQVYETLLRTKPESEAAFRVLVKLVDLDLRRTHYKDALGRLKNFKFPDASEPETEAAVQNLKAMIRRTATEHHEIYRKKHTQPDLEIAEMFYGAYLSIFLSHDDPRHETPEVKMYLADVKRELGKSKEASQLYREVIESRDKRYAKEAGVLWTASLAEALKKLGPTRDPNEPSNLEKEFVDAADQMQDTLSDTAEGREAAIKAAQVLAGYKNTQKEAIKRARNIVSRAPKTPQALTAAKLWIQLLSDRAGAQKDSAGPTEELQEAIREIRANPALLSFDQENGGKLKVLLADQDTRAKIGNIARSEKEKDYTGAAKGYEAFGNEATSREIAEKSYASAISGFIQGGDPDGATRLASAWLKRFPKSALAVDSIRSAATAALIRGYFEHSGKLFEKLGRENSDPASLETAENLFEADGDQSHSDALKSVYLESYPRAPHRGEILLALARSKDSANQQSDAGKAYETCMRTSPDFRAECASRLGDLYARTNDLQSAKETFRKAAGRHSKGSEISPFVGYARYRLAYLIETEARFEPLQLPEKRLKAAINQRVGFLEPLNRAYSAAVEAGGPWGVAALHRLASWAMNFADEVDKIPPSANSTPEAVAEFKKNLRTISQPLREKAVATWVDAFRKAGAEEILSPVLPEIADQVADAHAQKFFRAQGFHGKLVLAGMPADGGKDGSSAALQKVRDRLIRNAQDSAAWVDYGNLLWGKQKPLLAKIAYDRALGLNVKNPAALNNRAVVILSSEGEDDWFTAATAMHLLSEALRQDSFFVAAKFNRAAMLNYYRLFSRSRTLWEQVLTRFSTPETQDGLAIALQGTGQYKSAENVFKKASDLGGASSRFAQVFHEAARSAVSLRDGADRCISRLSDIGSSDLTGFEKTSVEHLKRTCTQWKEKK